MAGEQIGPYKILKLIGKGGMGIVHLGVHTKLEQQVAIKVMTSEYFRLEEMRERFIQEAKLQARLSHPNVVNILNYLEDESNIYLVMEYVDGKTLEQLLQDGGALPVPKCLQIMDSVLSALEFMHGRGIIHRDIKPANIMFTESGQVKVTDFGIAKALGSKGMTKTGTQLGTVWYMSPERIRGEAIDHATDIYALGVTLYQMVTGQVPFNSDSEYEVMRAHIEEPPAPPIGINSEIPELLNDIILKALAKDPKDRFPSAAAFREALHQVTELRLTGHLTLAAKKHETPMEKFHAAVNDLRSWITIPSSAEEGLYLGRFNRRQLYLLLAASAVVVGLLALFIFFVYPGSQTIRKLPLVEKSIPANLPQNGLIARKHDGLAAPDAQPQKNEPLPPGVLPTPQEMGVPRQRSPIPPPADQQTPQQNTEKTPPQNTAPHEQEKARPSVPEKSKPDLSIPPKPISQKPGRLVEPEKQPPAQQPRTVSVKPPEQPAPSSESSVYSRMLRSSDPASKRRAAKIIYQKYLNDPSMVALANDVLLIEYQKQTDNRHHVDALSWLCNILGASREEKYRSTLKKVSEEAPYRKLREYAEKNLKKLSNS